MSTPVNAKPNRLIREKSPYLLQHAYNPVDWYPWGEEAFQKAKAENKPVLVSIGYSTCHWCHVMEHESFEKEEIAKLMNENLVCIKVDREERPDVDKIYMTAVSAMTGSGGWPLNVFLTPERKPFFGGTYFPPEARWGHPGWPEVVKQIGASWRDPNERLRLADAGSRITEALAQYTAVSGASEKEDLKWLDNGFKSLKDSYDAQRGGFGHAPKFPMPVYHNFLLRYYARTGNKEALEMSLHTLREMAKGGIYDHLGGGFARYSTDANWHIPHFEKMLYDNAQLALVYIDAYQITRDPELRRIAQETLAYIQRDMTHASGGFYSAEDADSLPVADATEKKEGAFYVWERSEVLGIAGEKSGQVFAFRYGVRESGNAAQDPHGEFTNKNILYIAHPLPETAKEFHLTEAETVTLLAHAKAKLFEARSRLPRPHVDDKVIAAWNGLMISAFARGYQVFGDPSYLTSAERAATFLKTTLYDKDSRVLFRRWREGERQVKGIADDYAFVSQGALDLYEANFDPAWLAWSNELIRTLRERFWDNEHGGFFMTAVDQDAALLLRIKEDSDNVEPSASSVAALNLARLSQYLDQTSYSEDALKTVRAFGKRLGEAPQALPQLLSVMDFMHSESRQIVIAGRRESPDTQAMLQALHRSFIPVKTIFLVDGGAEQTALSKRLPFMAGMTTVDKKATAYVCKHHTCKQPTNDVTVFERQLREP